MKKLLKGMAVALGVSACMAGCESNDCILSSESYCSFSFVDGNGKSVKLLDTLSIVVNLDEYEKYYVYRCDTDTIVAQEPVDSLLDKGYQQIVMAERLQGVLLNRKSGADKVEIPLSYTVERDTFFFQYSARLVDTVWVDHLNHPYFSSMDCGTVMHYRILGVASTHHLIDSIQVVEPEVTNILSENVKIYYTVSN